MQAKKFLIFVFSFFIFIVGGVGAVNYVVDPYSLYNTTIFNLSKPEQASKMRLVKAIQTKRIKPKSIVLGTSRAEFGYDPTHPYFTKPSYNLAVSSGSMYENKLNFEWALKQGSLEQVLLVLDYRMLNETNQKNIQDFESYFDNPNIYKYLFSLDSFKDSLLTLKNQSDSTQYLANGQRDHIYNIKNIKKNGGHLATMKKDEKNYYKGYPTNYTYKDTKKDAFEDFEDVVKLCYQNNINLEIIFGPSHIRQWEALDYYLGFDTWLQWKKDVVYSVEKIAKKENKQAFKVVDFSVYHPLTAEEVPKDINTQMKYHWEASHYKHELGLIVLDRLIGTSQYQDFGVVLNTTNILDHLENQKDKRAIYIDSKKYKKEVFKN